MTPQSALDALNSLESYLNPAFINDPDVVQKVSAALRAGKLVVIKNAIDANLAEQLYRSLDEFSGWELHDSYGQPPDKLNEPFQYQHFNVYDDRLFPTELAVCQNIFCSAGTTRFIERLSGQLLRGRASFSASLYRPGNHSTPHEDVVDELKGEARRVAFVWHLTKGWRPEWGGALYWCPTLHYVVPAFNSLSLFLVSNNSAHCVTQVSPHSQGKRLAVNGWWRDTVPDGNLADCDSTKTTQLGDCVEII